MFLLVLFASKDPFPLNKSSKTRNHLKPGNLGTLFLLSALKMPNRHIVCHIVCHWLPSRSKILRKCLTFLGCLDFATVYSYFNIQMCSYFKLEIKSFVSLKNVSFLFRMSVHFRGEVSYVLPNFEGDCS